MATTTTAQEDSGSGPDVNEALAGAVERDGDIEIVRGYLTSFDGTRLYFARWTSESAEASDRPAVVVMHGYAEHIERYDELARHLVDAGYPVLGIDARGHGRSDGVRGYVERYDDYVHDLRTFFGHVRTRYPVRKIALFGHSNGGLIAIRFTQTHPEQIETLTLSGPLLGLAVAVPAWKRMGSSILTRLLPKLKMPGEIAPSDVTRNPEIVEAYANDPLIFPTATPRWYTEMVAATETSLERASEITHPLLVMHGLADKLVSPDATRRWFERVASGDKTLELLEGHYHEVFNEPERHQHYARLTAWLDEHYEGGGSQ